MQRIWLCIVESMMLSPRGLYAYRVIKRIPTTLDELDKNPVKFAFDYNEHPRWQTMWFVRDEEPPPESSKGSSPL